MDRRHSEWIAAAAPLVLGIALGATRLGSLDLPLMLANGERILADGAIPRTNVFSWVNAGHPYLNDKWGFMLLVASVERLGGTAALAGLKMLLGGILGGLLHLLARRSLRPGAAAAVACIALTMLSYRLHLRAEWLAYTFAAVVLVLLPRLAEGDRRAAGLALAVAPISAACHGYWVLGPVLLLAYGVGRRSAWVVTVGVVSIAAASISPFGVANVLHPADVLGQLSGPLTVAVTELRAPFSGGAPVTYFHVLALVLSVAAFAATVVRVRERRFGDALVLAALLAVSWRLDRNLALLGLTVPLSAAAAPRLAERAAVGAHVVWAAGLAGLVLGIPSVAVDRTFGPGEHPDRFPTALLSQLDPAWSSERYVNDFSLGSWLVRQRGTAFIDGNTEGYPPAFLARYRRILEGEESVESVSREFAPDGWFLRTSSAPTRVLVLGLFIDGRFAPALWDDVATLFRADLEPEEADRRWRAWLTETYVPRAGAWFPDEADARASAGAALAARGVADDVAVLRGALELQPWSAALYRDLADAYSAHGDMRNAARCRRWAFLLTPE
jgi:hypothetical protein